MTETENEMCPIYSRAEKLVAALSFATAYVYVDAVTNNYRGLVNVPMLLLCGLLIAWVEFLNRGKKPCLESFFWLGCFVCCGIRLTYEDCIGSVWEEYQVYLFIHIFFVWWVLCRSGKLLEEKTGHYLPADGLNGFVILPFGHYFLRIKAFFSLFVPEEKKEKAGKKTLWVLLAAALCLLLFWKAASLLSKADSGFGDLIDGFLRLFEIDWGDFWLRFVFSLPVGAWLYGLIGGAAREDRELQERQNKTLAVFLVQIRRVPAKFFIAAVGLFSLMYLAFFVLQASYLFGAFTRTLPEGFIVSEYAREGFFELCRVIAVNFTLLWLVTRMAETDKSRLFKAVCVALLAESMLFAVIAFSKLALYISCFGYTPLRLQSSWLVCVLFAGCLCWTVNILTGKDVFRKWIIFSAAALTVLVFI